jgi:hypothetical protein
MYEMYRFIQEAYYPGRKHNLPLPATKNLKDIATLVVIVCSKQNEKFKTRRRSHSQTKPLYISLFYTTVWSNITILVETSDESFSQLPLKLKKRKTSRGEAIEAFYLNGGWTVREVADEVIR